ncbi:MAG: DUF3769 domain-containing protein, partial [Leptolyngbyaceae cyanobacterium]
YLVPPPEPAVTVSAPLSQEIKSRPIELIGSQPNPAVTYSLSGADRPLLSQTEQQVIQALSQINAVEALIALQGMPTIGDRPLAGSQVTGSETPTLEPTLILQPIDSPSQATPASPAPALVNPVPPAKVLELKADRQEYDQQNQIFTAEGNVSLRYQGALLKADQLQVNLINRIAIAKGNVVLTRGEQVLLGEQLRFNFVQGSGTIYQARGDVNITRAGSDLNPGLTGESTDNPDPTFDQPLRNVTSSGGVSNSVGPGFGAPGTPGGQLKRGGEINRLRFAADRVDFTPEGWQAQNIRITNDPFSPPELILKADTASFKRLSPLQDELRTTKPRLVFDQRVAVPLPITSRVIDRQQRQANGLFQIGYDDLDRGGLYITRRFNLFSSPSFQFSVAPEFFVQRAFFASTDQAGTAEIGSGQPLNPNNYGATARLTYELGPQTRLVGAAKLYTLDADEFLNKLRASLRLFQGIQLFKGIEPHRLALEYSYRDRLFNGSLGYQTVQTSLGAVLTSPIIPVGSTGIEWIYQIGFQNILADTDQLNLLPPIRNNSRVDLNRFQAATILRRSIPLWQGKALPPTATEGLRYSRVPLVPNLSLGLGVTGVASTYSNGTTQQYLFGNISLSGQLGHLAKNFLDYTAFNVTYSQGIGSGQSPFLFDRVADTQTIAFGLTQQIYGPLLIGFQTAFNLQTGQEISTDYILEYSRRTYGVTLRYNPVLQVGSLIFRVSDFNWVGGTNPFSDVTPVIQGITR